MICTNCGATDQYGADCEDCMLPLLRRPASNRLDLPPQHDLETCPLCKGRGVVRSDLDVPTTCTGCEGVGKLAA